MLMATMALTKLVPVTVVVIDCANGDNGGNHNAKSDNHIDIGNDCHGRGGATGDGDGDGDGDSPAMVMAGDSGHGND